MAGARFGCSHYYAGGQVSDTHPGFTGIAMLTAGTRAAEKVNTDILFTPLHFDHIMARYEERATSFLAAYRTSNGLAANPSV